MKYSTTIVNGKQEQVLIMNTTQKEALTFGGLEKIKGLTPMVVSFGSNDIFIGYGYTLEQAINNAKIKS